MTAKKAKIEPGLSNTAKPKRIVADTSVIIDGRISENYSDGKTEILIPKPVVQELEHQANVGRSVGKEGLDELERLQLLFKEKKISLSFIGEPLAERDIKQAFAGRVDEIVRELARVSQATLVTSDKTQASVARVYDIPCIYFEPIVPLGKERLLLEQFFDEHTMSVHLKEGVEAYAKRGRPGEWTMVKVGKAVMDKEEINSIIDELIEEAQRERGMMEMDKRGCTVIQLGPYRIVITRFPFSDHTEITAVRPITSLKLSDYKMSDKLRQRLEKKAEGILVVGPPGAGKSTFAQALAEFYMNMGKTVKTMEHPRDLQVPKEVTQYGPLEGSMKNTGDILLLVRPDYTIYDEVRKDVDFLVFEDLRLAGVGMVGVCHGAAPIDAIQRFVGKVDLGVIPQVVDTLIFIRNGQISTVYTLNMAVKVPTGMTEQDLARPIVEVKDFDSGDLEYEIYSYGEEVVVIPVKDVESRQSDEFNRISEDLYERIYQHVPDAKIESHGKSVNVFVPQSEMARIIGKGGQTVTGIEREFGVSINVMPSSGRARGRDASSSSGGGRESREGFSGRGSSGGARSAGAGRSEDAGGREGEVIDDLPARGMGKAINIDVGKHNAGKYMKVYAGGDYITMAAVNKHGEISIKRKGKNGKKLINAMNAGKKLRAEEAL